MSTWSELKESYLNDGMTTRLIYINIVIFIAINILLFLNKLGFIDPLSWVCMPIKFDDFIFKPWTIGTYMFSHEDPIHLIFNMFALYWFGRLVREYMGEHLILRIYIIGGIAGGIACILWYMLYANKVGLLLGASASIVAMLTAVATLKPNNYINLTFVGQVRLKYYALFFVVLFFVFAMRDNNTGGNIAHLGGMLSGYLLTKYWIRNGFPNSDIGWITKLFKKEKMHVTYRRPLSDMEYNTIKQERSHEIDRILDKIKKSGYDSLTAEERKSLFDESKR